MKTIVVNGANGYVASNFINKLIRKNIRVIALVRSGTQKSSTERMIDALSEMNDGEYVDTKNLKVYNYSLLDKDFSIPREQLAEIFGGEIDYFHFSASLKFDLKSKEEIFKTNVDGLENSIKVFSKYTNKTSRFFFIGTAYSCGKFTKLFKEEFYSNEDISRFRNYYEQSKRYAENILKRCNEERGLKGHIIRLSQVVGHSHSGVTKTDYGIFDFTKRIYSLTKRYPGRTVRVHVDPESTQNLIPINTVVKQLCRTVEKNYVPVIMNFVAKKSIKNVVILRAISKLLPINIIPLKYMDHNDMDALERLVAAGMSFTGAYKATNLQFDTKARDSVFLPESNEVNEQTVYKMLEYFIDNLSDKKGKQTMGQAV